MKIKDRHLIKVFLLICCGLFFLPAYSAITLKNISEDGLKIYNQKMSEYPAMDVNKIEKEAEEKYPLAKAGDEVTVDYKRSAAKGKFYSIDEKYIKIGSTNVPIVDVDSLALSKFSPMENKKYRDRLVKSKKDEYNTKKLEFREKLLDDLFEQYPAINEAEINRYFRKISDPEIKKKYLDSFKNAYESGLPAKVPRDDYLKALCVEFIGKNPELVMEDDLFLLKAEKDAKAKRLTDLKEKSIARIKERFLCPKTATPTFEPDGGTFDPSIPVKISSTTAGSEIRYTLDGEDPEEDSPVYSEPIKLSHPVVIKARSFHNEFNDSDLAETAPWAGGLYGSYFEYMTFKGKTVERVDPCLNFDWGGKSPFPDIIPVDCISMIWTGQIVPRTTEQYVLQLTCDDGARLWIGDKLLIDMWKEQGAADSEAKYSFEAGKKYDIKVCLAEVTGNVMIKLQWSSPTLKKEVIPQECLLPEGKYVSDLKQWNKFEVKNEREDFSNRAKMTNPASHLGSYKLPVNGGQKRSDQLGIK